MFKGPGERMPVPSGGTACDQCGMDSAGRVEMRLRRQVGSIMEGPSLRI